MSGKQQETDYCDKHNDDDCGRCRPDINPPDHLRCCAQCMTTHRRCRRWRNAATKWCAQHGAVCKRVSAEYKARERKLDAMAPGFADAARHPSPLHLQKWLDARPGFLNDASNHALVQALVKVLSEIIAGRQRSTDMCYSEGCADAEHAAVIRHQQRTVQWLSIHHAFPPLTSSAVEAKNRIPRRAPKKNPKKARGRELPAWHRSLEEEEEHLATSPLEETKDKKKQQEPSEGKETVRDRQKRAAADARQAEEKRAAEEEEQTVRRLAALEIAEPVPAATAFPTASAKKKNKKKKKKKGKRGVTVENGSDYDSDAEGEEPEGQQDRIPALPSLSKEALEGEWSPKWEQDAFVWSHNWMSRVDRMRLTGYELVRLADDELSYLVRCRSAAASTDTKQSTSKVYTYERYRADPELPRWSSQTAFFLAATMAQVESEQPLTWSLRAAVMESLVFLWWFGGEAEEYLAEVFPYAFSYAEFIGLDIGHDDEFLIDEMWPLQMWQYLDERGRFSRLWNSPGHADLGVSYLDAWLFGARGCEMLGMQRPPNNVVVTEIDAKRARAVKTERGLIDIKATTRRARLEREDARNHVLMRVFLRIGELQRINATLLMSNVLNRFVSGFSALRQLFSAKNLPDPLEPRLQALVDRTLNQSLDGSHVFVNVVHLHRLMGVATRRLQAADRKEEVKEGGVRASWITLLHSRRQHYLRTHAALPEELNRDEKDEKETERDETFLTVADFEWLDLVDNLLIGVVLHSGFPVQEMRETMKASQNPLRIVLQTVSSVILALAIGVEEYVANGRVA